MSRVLLFSVLATALLASCSIRIPDATYVCSDTEPCPGGFDCSEGLCRRHALEVDASTCVAETCNGLDDDCDGFIDDGVTVVSEPSSIDTTEEARWNRVVPLDGGAYLVVLSMPTEVAGTYDLLVARFDASGALVSGPTDIGDSTDAHFEATRFGSNFYVARMGAANTDLVLDQFDVTSFARVGTEHTIVAGPYDQDALDIVANPTAVGNRVSIAYRANDAIHLASVDVPALTDELDVTVHTADVGDPTYVHLRLAVAPCSKGLYLAGYRDAAEPEIRVHALTFEGVVDAPPLEISADAPNYVNGMTRPILVGGSCTAGPSEILLGWNEADQPISGSATVSIEHVDRFAITHSAVDPTQTFARIGRWTIEPESLVVPQFVFAMLEPVSLARLTDGRLFAGVATISIDQSTGGLELYELMPDGTSFHHPTGLSPVAAVKLDFASTNGTLGGLRLGASRFTNNGTAATYSIGCAP